MIDPAAILIIGPSWVGDMVMAQSLFKILRQRHPDAAIDVVAPAWSAGLLARMPEVRRAITVDIGHGQLQLRKRYRQGRRLRGQYRQAIVLPNSWKSALLPLHARIPLRTGFTGEMRLGLLTDRRRLDKTVLRKTVERFVALGLAADEPLPAALPQPRLLIEHDNVDQALQRLSIPAPQTPVLALCPGAEFGPAKRWPEAAYAGVARQKLAAGWAVWLFGSQADRPVTDHINTLTDGRCIDLAGRTQLPEAIDLMSLASQVVTNDSGLMHVAAALHRPLVAVYGSSDPGFTPPLSDNARIVSLGLDCSPCFQRECPLGHMDCLKQLPADRVLTALEALPCAS